ncbi:MAG TPA: RDD family protein [Phycisphaeraceae bacterium]
MVGALILGWGAVGGASPAGATVEVAGDGRHLWAVQSLADRQEVQVLHRGQSDEPYTLHQARRLRGRVVRGGVAAADDTLWLVFDDGAVQSIQANRSALDGRWFYRDARMAPLPAGVSLRALAADGEGLWALLRVESPQALEWVDQEAALKARGSGARAIRDPALRLALGLPPLPESEESTTQPAESDSKDSGAGSAEAASQSEEAVKEAGVSPILADRLVCLRNGRWERVSLPEGWSQGAAAALVGFNRGRGPITLLALPEPGTLEVYRRRGEGWRRQIYRLDRKGAWKATELNGQLILAQLEPAAEKGASAVRLLALRRGQMRPVGRAVLEVPGGVRDWSVAPMELTVGIAASSVAPPSQADRDRLNLWWLRMDLQGRLVRPMEPMRLAPQQTMEDLAGYWVVTGALALTALLVLVFWRGGRQRPTLPADVVLADLGLRGLAAVIDLAPAVLLVVVGYELTPMELLMNRWPRSHPPASWQVIEPAMVAIGLYVAYSLVSELLTGRTLGKSLMGLRVVTLRGTRPRAWQIFVRNVLKSIDLVTWLLLLLPLIGLYRQRLGDIVAGTIVVMPAPPEEEPEQGQR